MKYVLALLVTVLSAASYANTLYVGTTRAGVTCSVNMNLENQNIVFHSIGTGFGFMVSEADVKEALSAGQTNLTFVGGDGPISARLTVAFNSDGSVNNATYTEKKLFFSKTTRCLEMKKSNSI